MPDDATQSLMVPQAPPIHRGFDMLVECRVLGAILLVALTVGVGQRGLVGKHSMQQEFGS